jgi:hypothetical protein
LEGRKSSLSGPLAGPPRAGVKPPGEVSEFPCEKRYFLLDMVVDDPIIEAFRGKYFPFW